jgi:hypothetical protein
MSRIDGAIFAKYVPVLNGDRPKELNVKIRPSRPSSAFDPPLPALASESSPARARLGMECSLDMGELYERLALLTQLELPCAIFIAAPSWVMRGVVLRSVAINGQDLSLTGESFSLRLRGDGIGSIRLVNRRERGEIFTTLEIRQLHGALYASIGPAGNEIEAQVWRDVMENPLLGVARG